MVDKIQQISSGSAPAKPSLTSASPVSSGLSSSSVSAKPVAANSSALLTKKSVAKKVSAKRKVASAKVKSVRKTSARKVSAAEKATAKTVKATQKLFSSPASSLGLGAGSFDSVFKSGEAFFNFKPTGQSMEKIMSQSKIQIEKLAQDATSMSKETVEACIKSSNLWLKGCEELMRTAMSLAQSSAEKQTKLVKEAFSSKTLNEFTEAQNKIAQHNFDDFMSGATKISEQYVKVLTACSEPVNAQLSKAVKKATSLAA